MLARTPNAPTVPTAFGPAEGSGAAERSSDFRNATRHSRKVRVLKIALPALGLVMAALFVQKSLFSGPAAVEITADDTAVSEGKLVMANPKLQGYTSDDLPYAVSALRAVQDVANETVVDLQEIGATVPLNDKTTARIEALHGQFDRTTNVLLVDTPIRITTSDGAVASLGSAKVELAAGRMSTDKPVEIRANGATIAADGMSVEDHGKRVVFEKRVRVHIVPPAAETASQ